LDTHRPNPHVALSVAAAFTYWQLSAKRPQFYDVEHYSEVLNTIARALSRLIPLYIADVDGGPRRALREVELNGASVVRGATVLTLADGRSFRYLWVLRNDLREAIAVLGHTSLREIIARRGQKEDHT
jgi:hypothetical protein